MRRVNTALDRAAAVVTKAVGNMYAAIVFGLLTLVSLPAVIQSHNLIVLVQWLGSVFLQLVLLPIIMVGQDQQAAKTEKIIRETHREVIEALGDVRSIATAVHAHLTKGTPDADQPVR